MPVSKEISNFKSTTPASVSASKAELRRVLRMRDLVMLVIGTVIGSGIFLVPGAVLRPVGGSVTLALLVWLSGGVLSLLGALTYGELTALHPEAGGLYVVFRHKFRIDRHPRCCLQ